MRHAIFWLLAASLVVPLTASDWYYDLSGQAAWGRHFVCFVLGAEVDWNGMPCPEDHDVHLNDIPDCDPSKPSELQLKEPKSFCDKPLTSEDAANGLVHDLALHCSCCADHLWKPEQLARKSQLLIPGNIEEVPVFVVQRKEDSNEVLQFCRAGRVPMVTLGDGIKPTVVCDRKQLYCRCHDRSYGIEGWKETEERCHIGERCLSEDNFPEGLTQVPSSKDLIPGSKVWLSPSPIKDSAHHRGTEQSISGHGEFYMRVGTVVAEQGEPVTGQRTEGHTKDTFVSVMWAGEKTPRIHSYTELLLDNTEFLGVVQKASTNSEDFELLKGCNADGARISTGAARCHDMDTSQCHMFYSNLDTRTGTKCKVEQESVRMCHPTFQRLQTTKDGSQELASVVKMSDAYEYYSDRNSILRDIAYMFYTPDTGWQMTFDGEHKLKFAAVPSAEEVMSVLAKHGGAIKNKAT